MTISPLSKIQATTKSAIPNGVSLEQAKAAGVRASLDDTAKNFESLFVQTVLQTMHSSKIENGLFDDEGQKPFQDMLDHAYSQLVTNSMNTGLRDAIKREYGKAADAYQNRLAGEQGMMAAANVQLSTVK
jgi:peptidoglycan hydrolase FlgJ